MGYSAINHFIVSKVLSNKLLIIIEVLLIVSILVLLISDAMAENFFYLGYIQRNIPITETAGFGFFNTP